MQISIGITVKGARTSDARNPVVTVFPVISGNTTIGSTLTLTSVGSYTGAAPITYTYQWYRGVTAIIGQTSTTYITQSADVGLQVTCQVKASNAYGGTFAPSNYIIAVALFTTTWTTTAPNQTITLPYVPTGIYSGTINWGDSTTSVNNGTVTTHTYATAGTYTVVINGNCDGWNFNQIGGSGFITSVEWWGQLKLTAGGTYNFGGYFVNCYNLDLSTVSDVLDLTGVTIMSQMFADCTSLTTISRINEWDTSAVTNMSAMFSNCILFNQPLTFNTSAVTEMISMFSGCTSFNQPLTFNTSAVINMETMFSNCTSFNQPLSFGTSAVVSMGAMFYGCTNFNQALTFNTAAVTNMSAMFYGATSFNQPLNFNTSSVTNMVSMFDVATAFNQPLSFNTSSVTYMGYMFNSCTSFNQALSFNTVSVTDMISMFSGATSFNQPLSFNTAAVTDMNNMFSGCTSFNQPLSFNTSSVTNMSGMFEGATSFNQALSFNTAAVTDMVGMFYGATSFNQPLSFNTAAVTNMSYMFYGATAFNQNIGGGNVSSLATAADFMATKTPATFSTANLDAIYNGWSTTAGIILGVDISFGSAKYTAAGTAGRAYLTGTKLWTITDGGLL